MIHYTHRYNYLGHQYPYFKSNIEAHLKYWLMGGGAVSDFTLIQSRALSKTVTLLLAFRDQDTLYNKCILHYRESQSYDMDHHLAAEYWPAMQQLTTFVPSSLQGEQKYYYYYYQSIRLARYGHKLQLLVVRELNLFSWHLSSLETKENTERIQECIYM